MYVHTFIHEDVRRQDFYNNRRKDGKQKSKQQKTSSLHQRQGRRSGSEKLHRTAERTKEVNANIPNLVYQRRLEPNNARS